MRPLILITMGDPAGVGPEIAVKALSDPGLYDRCVPVVVGAPEPLRQAAALLDTPLSFRRLTHPAQALGRPGTVEYLCPDGLETARFVPGIVSGACGEAAFTCITTAIRLALQREADAVATAPINKEALHLSGHAFAGHTEIFAHYTGSTRYAMLLIAGSLRVIHCTTHVSMRQACDLITRERVLSVIRLGHTACSRILRRPPRIAVAGLNPHCSENGLFGDEEARAIAPAVADAQKDGILAEGPLPPDTVFVKAACGQYDLVVAMYHDQGHIPIKLMGFHMDEKTGAFSQMSGVNVTVGLPIIRTSVDHGTAFDRAGQNRANPQSMTEAILLAADMAEGRRHEQALETGRSGG